MWQWPGRGSTDSYEDPHSQRILPNTRMSPVVFRGMVSFLKQNWNSKFEIWRELEKVFFPLIFNTPASEEDVVKLLSFSRASERTCRASCMFPLSSESTVSSLLSPGTETRGSQWTMNHLATTSQPPSGCGSRASSFTVDTGDPADPVLAWVEFVLRIWGGRHLQR